MSKYILEAKGIVKTFPGVKALDGVSLNIKKGEVHALVGENGAGKSTLMLCINGIHKLNAGEIFIDGKKVFFNSAKEAQANGIGTVFQELSLVPELSIAENIFANRQPTACGLIQKKDLNKKAIEMLKMFNLQNIDPNLQVKFLSIAKQQVVEILKAMSMNPKVLILDEPTSSLTEIEVQELFNNIRILKERGIAFIYISHHLNEIFQIADRATVLRDGKYICDDDVKDIDEDYLVSKMVGRKIVNIYGKRKEKNKIGSKVFEVKHLTRKNVFKDVSFYVKKGEIVGLSGLVGAGRTEIGRAIFGAEKIDSGEIYLENKLLRVNSTKQAIESGIGYMTENRKEQGLYLNFSILQNFISNRLRFFSNKAGFMQEKKISNYADNTIKDFSIITPSKHQIVGNLSGGNEQKVLLSTWVGIAPKVLIVDEPTRGVDVGAKSEIYEILRNLASTGVAIIMISSDLPEVLGVSDRIIVIKDGQIIAEQMAKDATEESVIGMASMSNIN